jgi:hypothetical protein
MYDPTKSYGVSVWLDHCSTTAVTSFPFVFPTDPCELVITHASQADHASGPNLNAHISTVKGDISGIDATKTGNAESILCYAKNTHNDGAVTASYIAPGAACFLNVKVARLVPGSSGTTAQFGLLCNHAPLKA